MHLSICNWIFGRGWILLQLRNINTEPDKSKEASLHNNWAEMWGCEPTFLFYELSSPVRVSWWRGPPHAPCRWASWAPGPRGGGRWWPPGRGADPPSPASACTHTGLDQYWTVSRGYTDHYAEHFQKVRGSTQLTGINTEGRQNNLIWSFEPHSSWDRQLLKAHLRSILWRKKFRQLGRTNFLRILRYLTRTS